MESSLTAPPAARAADSMRRRAITSWRSKASSRQRARIVGGPRRAGDDRLGHGGARRRRGGAERPRLERHGPPVPDRQAGLGQRALHQGTGGPLGRAAPGQERHDDPRPRDGAGRRRGRSGARDPAAARCPRRHWTRHRRRTPRGGPARRDPRAPAAAPGRATWPPASATNPTPQASCSNRAS